MATHTGSEGTILVGTDPIAEIRSFSLESTSEVIEDSSMGDTDRTFKAGLKSFTGSVEVFWDETDAAQIALEVGASVTLKVYPEGNTAGDKYYEGTVIVTGLTVTSSFDGMVEAAISVQGTGALTLSTVA
jgi:predicted secreted protein